MDTGKIPLIPTFFPQREGETLAAAESKTFRIHAHLHSSQRDNPTIARRFNAGVLAHGRQSQRDG